VAQNKAVSSYRVAAAWPLLAPSVSSPQNGHARIFRAGGRPAFFMKQNSQGVPAHGPRDTGLVPEVEEDASFHRPPASGNGRMLYLRGGHHFTLRTSTPGKALPSSHSRKAPPAVET
jgi:hypothetical protein